MLTDQELNKIFSWLPYREDWPVDRNQKLNNIEVYYGTLIKSLIENSLFETYYSEDGSLGNYLEFFCYPNGHFEYDGNAIVVCISLCAPLAAYGQTSFYKEKGVHGWGKLFSPGKIGIVTDSKLMEIEGYVKTILTDNKLQLLDTEIASRRLPDDVVEDLKFENHNCGDQYLHGLFQKID